MNNHIDLLHEYDIIIEYHESYLIDDKRTNINECINNNLNNNIFDYLMDNLQYIKLNMEKELKFIDCMYSELMFKYNCKTVKDLVEHFIHMQSKF